MEPTYIDILLKRIEGFLVEHQMSATYFGKCSMNDSYVVRRLRNGGFCRPEYAAKIHKFMDEFVPRKRAVARRDAEAAE